MPINAHCARCGKGLDTLTQWWRYEKRAKDGRAVGGYLCHEKKPCDPKRVAQFRKDKRQLLAASKALKGARL